jgi:RNA polymerase sigma-70 factor (ECF subfamily)
LQASKQDTSALASIGAGSERAFLGLVERYHAGLLRVARLWLDDERQAEDVVRETWLRMLHRLDRFDEQASLKGWLCTALIELARARAGVEEEDGSTWVASDQAGPALDPARFSPAGDRWEGHWQKPPSDWPGTQPGSTLPVALRGELETVIHGLPSYQRIVLVLRDLEGLSSREVRNALGVSDEDQKTLLHRARSRIRAALETHYDQEPGSA